MIEKKRMQQRYGSQAEFEANKNKLLPNEFAVVTSGANTDDGTALYLKIGDNEPKKIGDNVVKDVIEDNGKQAVSGKAVTEYITDRLHYYAYLYWDKSHNIFDSAFTRVLDNTTFTNQDDTKNNKYLVCLPARVTEIKSGTFKYPNNILRINCEGAPSKIKIAEEYKQIEIRQINLGDSYKLSTLVDLGKNKANKEDVVKSLNTKADKTEIATINNQLNTKADISNVNKELNKKADKSTTIEGYGVTNVYNKSDAIKLFERTINKVDNLNFQLSDAELKTKYTSEYALKSYNQQYVDPIQDDLNTAQDDIDDLKNIKADKSTTLKGYGITDAYSTGYIDNAFLRKFSGGDNHWDVVPVQSSQHPVISGGIYNALDTKYDKSNVEIGRGNLTMTDERIKSANFEYQMIGDYATVIIAVVFNEATLSKGASFKLTNMPFVSKSNLGVYNLSATNKYNLLQMAMASSSSAVVIRPSTLGVANLQQDERVTFTLIYKIH